VIVRLIKKKKIYNFTLPTKISGNYWITDNDYLGNVRNLINVEEDNGKWKIKSDFETKIMSGEMEVESAYLKDYSLYFLKINTDNEYVILYCSPTLDKESFRLKLKNKKELLIGNQTRANIAYSFPLVSKDHAKLYYNNGIWIVQDLGSKYGTYVNNIAITTKKLEYGDIIFIMGLKIIVLKDTLIINNIGQLLSIDASSLESVASINQKQIEFDNPDEEAIEFYKEDDYFYRAPRFKTGIQDAVIQIDPPPGGDSGEQEKTPLIYTLGPMLTMAMSSMTTGISALQGVINGTSDWGTAAPSLLMTGGMMATMMIWPQMQAKYQAKLARKAAKERTVKYLKYLDSKKEEIQSEMKVQRQILIDNYLPLDQTKEIIYQKKRNLWEREISQPDFLDLRLGLGSSELRGQVNIPDQHFEVKTDELLKEVYKVGAQSKTLENVPVSLNFVNRNIVAIIGTAAHKNNLLKDYYFK